ncbi:Amidohydrolase 2 [Mycena indigotica]|uniref:Amidohydrolase 2 n=1 Tax=Mycena indigotica TaxID=2126181 RepID=A0A8H6SLY8_9AGAR|nr:Amidohydrolase 2 [Mycena indigotica]KAF7301851.1 Amidohydrolase 2 [Mycena indigotica]
MALAQKLLVDIHTHVYLPRYAALLRARSAVPRILSAPAGERLLILDHEPSGGRPVGPQYWDREEKIGFMDRHGIDVSVVSSANPWLDFLQPDDAQRLATELNDDLEAYCAQSPSLSGGMKRLYGFGLLPLVPGVPIPALLESVDQISKLPHLKGVILGTRGIGAGLDDPSLSPLWGALSSANLVAFLHPHYGVGDAWGPRDNGHVLPLALGFPFETTAAATRLILSGALDAHPTLKILLAHAGGALPQLSSRLASCIDHDPVVASRLAHDARWYLGKLHFDAVAYGPEELGFVSDVVARSAQFGDKKTAGFGYTVDRKLGSRNMLFGTDHPFFPPLSNTDKWRSVVENLQAIDAVSGWGDAEKDGVRGGNALALFGLA